MRPGQGEVRVAVVIATGGALGALARHGVGTVLPHQPGAFPLGTFLVNVAGCLLIGALAGLLAEPAHPLLRPFLATGILGGFTTFSAYAVEADQLVRAGQFGTAAGYVGGTLVTALAATWLGIRVTREARRRQRGGR